ncbi:MAG: PHP domain-containing protein [Roseburia sp.]|nr:PHP domain-containing protein [Roseburia sp.]
MPYIYETHLHTTAASACAKSAGADYISFYKELGYTGIIVTDHFFNGNCSIPKNLPWEERVNLFCRGYEEAKAEGDRQGLQVFFAWEARFDGDEFLIYGLDKAWLLAHPEMMEWDHLTHHAKIRAEGGLVVQAHPFRERGYLSEVYVHPHQCDAFEVANAGNPHEQNRMAFRYAREHDIPMTAGSDIHHVGHTDNGRIYGLEFEQPLSSIADYVRAVKSGTGYALHVPPEDIKWVPGTTNRLPVFIFDRENRPHPADSLEQIFSL